MATATTLGFARMGANRELKKALEAYWAGRTTAAELLAAAKSGGRTGTFSSPPAWTPSPAEISPCTITS